jgi:hypothetical protein
MCFYLFVGSDPPLARIGNLFIYLMIMLVTIVFEISLAMFFSLAFRSTVQSMIGTYSILLLLFGTPVAAYELLYYVLKMQAREVQYFLFFSPFEAIYSVSTHTLGSSGTQIESFPSLWPPFLIAYTLFSLLLMGYVFSAFERQSLESTRIR